MIASETRETPRCRAGFFGAFLCVLTLAALSGTEAGAVGRGALESAVAQYLRVEQLPLANPTDGQVLGYDSATKRAVWQDSSATIGGSLGSTDNAIPRADGTGGVTLQGSDATLSDAEVLNLTATGALALGTDTSGVRLKVNGGALAVMEGDESLHVPVRVDTLDVYRTSTTARSMTLYSEIDVGSGVDLRWYSSTDLTGSVDTAIGRDSAGRALVHNGSGTAADLRLAGVHYGATAGIVRTMGKQKTLTDNVATSIITISQAAGERSGGIVQWTVIVDDGTDRQVRTGSFTFAAEDKSGTLVSDLDVGATESVAVSAGTLSVTPTIADGSNALSIQITADTSLTASPVIRFVFTSFCDSTVTLP